MIPLLSSSLIYDWCQFRCIIASLFVSRFPFPCHGRLAGSEAGGLREAKEMIISKRTVGPELQSETRETLVSIELQGGRGPGRGETVPGGRPIGPRLGRSGFPKSCSRRGGAPIFGNKGPLRSLGVRDPLQELQNDPLGGSICQFLSYFTWLEAQNVDKFITFARFGS